MVFVNSAIVIHVVLVIVIVFQYQLPVAIVHNVISTIPTVIAEYFTVLKSAVLQVKKMQLFSIEVGAAVAQ